MSDEDRTNPKDRIGLKKVPLHLLPTAGLIHEAMAMGNGAQKYGPFNWRDKEVIATVYISACQRHLLAWLDGEEDAADSGIHHLGHAKACLGIILDAMATDSLKDDRPVPGAAQRLLDKYSNVLTAKAGQPLEVNCPYHMHAVDGCELCVKADK